MIRYGRVALVMLSFFSGLAWAQNARRAGGASSLESMSPEALGAKAFLEDLLARRYSQELSTMVNRQSFSLGAQLTLTPVAPPKITPPPEGEPEPINDLMLGTIDPEALIKKYAPTDQKQTVQGFLQNYRIKTVQVAVGLSEELDSGVKEQVEKWLKARVSSEFGSNGKGVVTVIQAPTVKKNPHPKTLLDYLEQFQPLAGQLVLALALLLGVLLWRLLSSSSSSKVEESATQAVAAAPTPAPIAPSPSAEGDLAKKQEQEIRERESIEQEIDKLTQRLIEIVPRVNQDFEAIVRSWCQMGEAGFLRLACFAEAVGREAGKLPIPVDAISEVSKVFAKMTDMEPSEKRNSLQKAYWDLLSALNLGAESLNQPFGYLGGLNLGIINQALMDENPKLKTLVTLYMPRELRTSFVRSLNIETKRELLASAAELSSISSNELKTLDSNIAGRLKPSGSQDQIPLEMTLNKLVETLSPVEEATLLTGLTGRACDDFKRSYPSIAFLDQWPDDKLRLLLDRAPADQVEAMLRVRPELKDRLIALCPPMTAEMVNDELARPDKLSDEEKNQRLKGLSERLQAMVEQKEVNLGEIFAATTTPLQAVPNDDGELKNVS